VTWTRADQKKRAHSVIAPASQNSGLPWIFCCRRWTHVRRRINRDHRTRLWTVREDVPARVAQVVEGQTGLKARSKKNWATNVLVKYFPASAGSAVTGFTPHLLRFVLPCRRFKCVPNSARFRKSGFLVEGDLVAFSPDCAHADCKSSPRLYRQFHGAFA